MPRRKYDWDLLKTEYMIGKHIDAIGFMREKYGPIVENNGNIIHAIGGWRKEKEEMYSAIREQVMVEAKEKIMEVYRPSMKELGEMHKASIQLYKASLQHIMKESIDKKTGEVRKMPNVSALGAIWNVIKTEKGEATTIQENTTTTIDEEKKQIVDSLIQEIDDEQ